MPASGYTRWAILATPQIEKSGLADLLASALSKTAGMQLVEREQVRTAIHELAVTELLGSAAVAERLKLGKLLKADALILLAMEPPADKKKSELLRVVLSETRYGARLRLDSRELSTNLEALCGEIADLVRGTRARYPSGVTSIVAVPPFVSNNIVKAYEPLRSHFAHVLESALAVRPGTAVLEIEEARAIRGEQDLTGGNPGARLVPIFVQGAFRIEKSSAEQTVKLSLQISRTSGEQRIDRDFADEHKVAAFLSTDAAAQILAVSMEELQQTLSPGDQVRLLVERADVFARRGEFVPATSLREAALLVDPNNAEQNEALLRECLTLAPYPIEMNWTAWRTVTKEFAFDNFTQRTGYWTRAIEMLEHMIRNRLIDYDPAKKRIKHLRGMGMRLLEPARELWTAKKPIYDRATAELFRKEEARCAELYRAFVQNTIPEVSGLRGARGSLWAETTQASFPPGGQRGDPELLDSALDLEYNYTVRYDRSAERSCSRALTNEQLDHYARVLLKLAPNQPMKSRVLQDLLTGMGTNPDFARDVTSEQYIAFLGRLRQAEQEMVRLFGDAGLLLFEAQYGRNRQKLSDREITTALDEWEARAIAYGKRVGESAHDFAWVREELALPRSGNAPLPALPPRASEKAEITYANEVGLDLVPRAEHAAWDTGQGYPIGMLRASGFDVFWNYGRIWIHREAGVLRELADFRDKNGPSLRDVTWDGQYIWAVTASDGVRIYRPDGGLLAESGPADGLPTAERGARLAPLSSGRVLAIGSLGIRNHAWCATLELAERKVRFDLFHEAVFAREQAKQERPDENDPRVGFVPYHLYRIPGGPNHSKPSFLLACGDDPEYENILGTAPPRMLRVVPEERKVMAVNFELSDPSRSRFAHPLSLFLDTGDCLMASGDWIQHRAAPQDSTNRKPVVRTLFENSKADFKGEMLVYEGYAYAPGQPWARVNLKTLAVEPLGIRKGKHKVTDSFLRWGVSEKLGLMAWDEDGLLYRVIVSPARTEADKEFQARIPELDASIHRNPRDEPARRKKVFFLFTAGRLDEAKEACLEWVRTFPHTLEARFALCEIERKLRSGLGVCESDPAWMRYPHPTFASHMLFTECFSYTEKDSLRAMKLPFAADETEWYIAELNALEAAFNSCLPRSFHPRTAIAMCNAWEAAAKARGENCDQSYLAIRAAARLQIGEYDAALRELDEAIRQKASGHVWVQELNVLRTAILQKNRSFEWEVDEPRYHRDWRVGEP